MRTFHLRFTPYDLSGYTFDWLDRYLKYIVAQEDLDDNGNPLFHYHIYIEADNAKDSIRDMAKNKLGIPSDNGRGKNNKYYALIPDWNDPGYICKYNQILYSKGFAEKTLVDFVISGKKRYLDKVESPPAELSGEKAPAARKTSTTPKSPRIPYQQQIIAIAYADWLNYKKKCATEQIEPSPYEAVEFVCKAMREQSRGINIYLVQDCVNALLYDDPDFRERTLNRIKSKIFV